MHPTPLATREDFLATYPLIRQLNPKMTQERFERILEGMLESGYKAVGIYEEGRLVALTGYWVGWKFWCGKYIEPDNVIVDESARGKGYGKALMRWIEEESARLGCELIVLDAYTTNRAAHRFYLGEGYEIHGFVFLKGYEG